MNIRECGIGTPSEGVKLGREEGGLVESLIKTLSVLDANIA
ncbi:hypothetical protein ABIE13_002317 [Ottowia thiooxydans]|uniref:Uncharacterized protein n=1 Tax=Ottowia thiooxydans TaxID=219182 RepID=A0ABV2Q840_9BURK